MKTAKLVKLISELTPQQMEALAAGLVWFDSTQAYRFCNALTVAQQERDLEELELEKQYEMMQRAEDSYNLDAIHYGERV